MLAIATVITDWRSHLSSTGSATASKMTAFRLGSYTSRALAPLWALARIAAWPRAV
jgi:hypothetical protein